MNWWICVVHCGWNMWYVDCSSAGRQTPRRAAATPKSTPATPKSGRGSEGTPKRTTPKSTCMWDLPCSYETSVLCSEGLPFRMAVLNLTLTLTLPLERRTFRMVGQHLTLPSSMLYPQTWCFSPVWPCIGCCFHVCAFQNILAPYIQSINCIFSAK